MSKPFFYRIDVAALFDFATEPEGASMTLLRFAKELHKGESDVEFIQGIIDETHNYIEKKKKAGSKGGMAKASSAKDIPSSAIANASTPLARNSNSSSNNTEAEEKKKRFTPPTREEVEAYCQERKNGVNPNRWYDYYSAQGWKVGRNKMIDWKAAVRTWEGNNGNGNFGSTGKAPAKTGGIIPPNGKDVDWLG